jgi:toxin ParE1/3/4
MEKKPKPVVYSIQFKFDIIDVYRYGLETFGKEQAEKYQAKIYRLVENLNLFYDIYPECRHLRTKAQKYRWIILHSHVIIYRIANQIQVLRLIHSHRSIASIKTTRGVKV